MNELLRNYSLFGGLVALLIAQGLKPFTHYRNTHEWDFVQLFSSGGMPSSHSAFISATTLIIGMQYGWDHPAFSIGVVIAFIVTYDAANVRWQSGLHAQKINQLIRDVFRGEPISEQVLKEVIGHTPKQVYWGIFIGALVATTTGYLFIF